MVPMSFWRRVEETHAGPSGLHKELGSGGRSCRCPTWAHSSPSFALPPVPSTPHLRPLNRPYREMTLQGTTTTGLSLRWFSAPAGTALCQRMLSLLAGCSKYTLRHVYGPQRQPWSSTSGSQINRLLLPGQCVQFCSLCCS